MAIESFSAGQLTATYNSTALGLTDGGYTLRHEIKQENIDRSDAYGDSLLDYVARGANVMCDFTMLSWFRAVNLTGNAAPAVGTDPAIMWPFSSNLYALNTAAAPVGRLASDMAKALVLTHVANTPSMSAAGYAFGPGANVAAADVLTANLAIVAPGFNVSHLYDSRVRKVEMRMQFLPYSSGGSVIWAATG
jgi:hypothetical protein